MLTLVLALALATPQSDAEAKPWHRAVGLLQYLEGDYEAAVASKDVDELAEQKAFAKEAVAAVEALGPPAAGLLQRTRALAAKVEAGDSDATAVAKEAGALANGLIQASGLARSPRHAPDLLRGAQVFQENCQSCHGPKGDGDTPAGKALKPPAANFHDDERMGGLTPYKAFNTTAFGILGTGMAPFPNLSEDDRWAVAFYVFTFRQKPCDGAPLKAPLDALATKTDGELAQAYGADAVRCLRQKMPEVDKGQSLAKAREGVEAAQRAFKRGDLTAARQALIDAYLDGVEPIEPLMRARDPQLVKDVEAGFGEARTALQDNTGFEAATGRLLAVIARADANGESKGTFWSVFFTAALILLREGFEAMVVVAALLAILKKLGARAHTNTVHAGWASALVVGALLYFFGQSLIAGARRELLETVVAFLAVAMLLYAALWLNARANISAHMGELREKMQSALTKQSGWGLFAISFSAVLRETAETALFLQGLATDSKDGTIWGAVAGLGALTALVVFVSRAGFRLPMKALFNASTVLLVATSVVLLGKGMHGLQELGTLSLAPIPFLDVPTLGLFPDAWPTVPQLVLLAAILGYAWSRRPRGLSGVRGAEG
jgi:high-affinity iron transporter